MKNIMKRIKSRLGESHVVSDERGLSTVEYVILLVLIVASCVGLWSTLGTDIRDRIDGANKEIETVNVTPSP